MNGLGTFLLERVSSKREGVAGVDHVVDENGYLAFYIANQDFHEFRGVLCLPVAFPMNQSEFDAEFIGNGGYSDGISAVM